jgi:hypothetical protein
MSIKPPLPTELQTKGRLPTLVTQLGYGGLIPFVVLAMAIWLADANSSAHLSVALVGYGASIASFLGAIHWGLAMRDTHQQHPESYAWGVIPSLAAWLSLLAEPAFGLYILAVLLWVCYAVDRRAYARYKLQPWLPMRLRLTVIASASCAGGAIGLLR